MKDLKSIIINLINKNKEGTYWDFKRSWHNNNANLIRDIISLSNTTDYQGDRYLIFGIDDESFEIHSISDDQNRKNQANLLDLISKIRFIGGYVPQVSLETINISNKELDIIIIEDNPLKPYCLQYEYKYQGERIYPGTVYSRTGDKNTAKDTTANLYQVEQMWKERLGIDKSPIVRLKQYLLNPSSNWISDSISKSYYEDFPEFSIINKDESVKSNGHWWSIFLDKETKQYEMEFYYHSTLLKTSITCYFGIDSIHVPFPDIDYVKINDDFPDSNNTLSFYSFTKGTFNFSLLYYLNNNYISKPQKLFIPDILPQKRNFIKNLPFIVFDSEMRKKKFIKYMEKNITLFYEDHMISKTNKLLDTEKEFSYWSYDLYHIIKEGVIC